MRKQKKREKVSGDATPVIGELIVSRAGAFTSERCALLNKFSVPTPLLLLKP